MQSFFLPARLYGVIFDGCGLPVLSDFWADFGTLKMSFVVVFVDMSREESKAREDEQLQRIQCSPIRRAAWSTADALHVCAYSAI